MVAPIQRSNVYYYGHIVRYASWGSIAAAHDGVSVSAWMTEAARRALVVRDGLAAVAEWERANGELTSEEMAAARRRVAKELTGPRTRSA